MGTHQAIEQTSRASVYLTMGSSSQVFRFTYADVSNFLWVEFVFTPYDQCCFAFAEDFSVKQRYNVWNETGLISLDWLVWGFCEVSLYIDLKTGNFECVLWVRG